MSKMYVLGSLNMDVVIESDRAPSNGETIEGRNFRTCPGGKGLNQAIAAAKLGADVRMLGAVGDDVFGKAMLKALEDNKVNIKDIKVIEDAVSGIAIIQLIRGDNRITLDLGANLKLENYNVNAFLAGAEKGDVFLTQLENDVEIVGYALKVAKSKGMITILNPAPANEKIVKYLEFVDIFTPNETEYDAFSGDDFFVKNVVITRGADGYEYITKEGVIKGEAPEVDVIDTTGAGDTFNGALAYKLSLGEELNKKTLDFATRAASISVTRLGSSVSSPTLEEVLKF